MADIKPINVALADDHDLFREGIRFIIGQMEHIEVVLEAPNGKVLLDTLADSEVDVILLDLQMDEMDGMETTKKLKTDHTDIPILILTMHDDERMINYMMELGVNGYLLKSTHKEELEEAIRTVVTKGFYFNDRVSQALVAGLKSRKKTVPRLNHQFDLSGREQEVLEYICKELNTQEIADKLFISPRTVEGHRKNLLEKFNVKSTVSLVIKAIREGLVQV